MIVSTGTVQAATSPPPPRDAAAASALDPNAGCGSTGWSRIALPGRFGSIGMDVATTNGRVRWVVGMHAGQGTPRRPWIVKRKNGRWRSVPTPNVGSDAGLVAIDAKNAKSAWAVGFKSVSRNLRPVAMRWNGNSWRSAALPIGSSRSVALTDVITANQTWAVGYRTTATGPRPYAARNQGGRWVRQDPTLASGNFGALTAVGGNATSGIWAAGWQSDRTGIRPLLVRRVGGKWQKVKLPGSSAPDTVLTSLLRQGDRMWAIGFRDDGSRQVPLLYSGKAQTWTQRPTASFAGSTQPDDAAIVDGRPVLVGGARQKNLSRMFHMAAVVEGGELQMTRRPGGVDGWSYLRSVVKDGKRAFAVGWTDGIAIAVASCRGSLDPVSTANSGSSAAILAMRTGDGMLGSAVAPEVTRMSVNGNIGAGAAQVATGGSTWAVENTEAVAVRFRNVAAKAKVAGTTSTYGATVLDFNGDGWDDLLISRHTNKARVLANRKGVFKAARSSPLAGRDRHGCAAADVDDDGKDEAYCAIGAARGVKFKSNELLMDLTSAGQHNDAGRLGGVEPFGRGRRATLGRLDGDSDPDLLVTADPLRVDGLPALNRAYRNEAGKRFTGAMSLGLDLPLGGDCALTAQLDGTGRREVILCTDEPWNQAAGLHIFRYRDGRYRDATKAFGVKPQGAIDAVVADFDGDGRSDIAQLSKTRLVVSLQRNNGLKRVLSMPISAGRAIAAGHVNGDRKADLYVVRGGTPNAPDRMLINRGTGRSFRTATIPQTNRGDADDVVTIDHDRNGLDDFLVLNGLGRPGPIQLIAAFRR